MADYILFAVAALSAAALGVPFLQYLGKRGNFPGYLLMVALSVALASIILNAATGSTSSSPFGSLLTSDFLGNLFAILTLFVSLFVATASLTLIPSGKSSNSPFYYSLRQIEQLPVLLLSPLLRCPRDAPHLLLSRPPHALRRLGAHEHPDLRLGRVPEGQGGV